VIAEKKYVRYFKGHRDRVVSLAVCPGSRQFLSSSLDDTVRLWDYRYKDSMGLLHKTGRSVVSFDSSGTCFAVASATNVIKLYDIRSFDKSPFSTFYLGGPPIHWGNINFSNNGKYLLLSTLEGSIYLFDAFKGDKLQEYATTNSENQFIEASFSPDDQFVLSGSNDGRVLIWDSLSGRSVASWEVAKSPVTSVKWNPTMMMVAAAGKNLDLWTPQRAY
jgi:COMPASS component SWD2